MMTASLRRRLPISPAAPPLEDDDLLAEILLRLPPLPSSLPRASAVCTRWRGLLSDPAFHRRFRIHHRRSPPLVGFIDVYDGITIQPALDAPDRIPRGRFSLEIGDRFRTLGWRHGLALFFLPIPRQLLVWDPVAGDLHRLAIPPEFKLAYDPLVNPINGAVLRAAAGEDADHFQVVLVGSEGKQHKRALACVYSSETGLWGDIVSTPLPPKAIIYDHEPALLAGDCLHWSILAASPIMLEFDLNRHSLAVTSLSTDMFTAAGRNQQFRLIRAEGGGLGFLFVSDYAAQLWRRETDCDGAVSWARGRAIELDKLFPPISEKDYLSIVGYAEENNVVFVRTVVGVFMLHLESLQFKRTSETYSDSWHYPFELVYTPGIGGVQDEAKVVRHRWLTRWTQYIRRLFS